MTAFFYALIAGLIIMSASLIGVLTVWKGLGSWTERNLKYLVSFSAGVFFIVALELSQEALELSSTSGTATLSLLAGVGLMFLVGWLMPESHHHHEIEDTADTHDKAGARRILFGDAIHNIGDGILLVPAFVVDLRLGMAAAVGVFVHEAIQEISEFFVLREGGYGTAQALLRNFLVSATILIGIALGFTLSNISSLVGPLLGVAAGAFFFVVFSDLIPRTIRTSVSLRQYAVHVLAGLMGAVLMIGVSAASGHGHHQEEYHHEEHLTTEISSYML